MAKHVGAVRKNAAHERIEKKIKILERYVAYPKTIKDGSFIPKDLASFRAWEDETLGVEKIGSPNTLDRPYNIGLKKYALELISRLANKKDRKALRTEIIAELRAQLRMTTRLTRKLTNQVHITRHELERARQSEERWQERVKQDSEEIGELRQKLNRITGLQPVASATTGDRS